ncbi:MAG: DUF3078 domain-containing protein [Bacteroidetes bacterium]|nr:DUF3078 domain-containing protein [Bacteroidota bacterium]
MKRIIVFIPAVLFGLSLLSNPSAPPDSSHMQELSDTTSYWKLAATGMLNLNQVAYANWTEGGESNIAGNTIAMAKANYLKAGFKADNFVSMAYGMTWNNEQGMRKTDDKLDIGTTIGYEAFENWFYSMMVNLKTQFGPGYKYPDDSTLVSDFMSPGRLYLSMGMEYKPDEKTSVFISPASGKFIFVLNQILADQGAYGVRPAEVDTAGHILVHGLNYQPRFGLNLVVSLNREIMKNVIMDTKLNPHNNYMDETLENRWNFDVDWETALNFKINSFLSSMVYLHLMYDNDLNLPTYEFIEGQRVETGQGPKLQVKENFGIGVMIKV